jgi:zinc/manganese transport system ATP-binding protein
MLAMADLPNWPLWRRSAEIAVRFTTDVRDALRPISRHLVSGVGGLARAAKAGLAAQLDGGYQPEIGHQSLEEEVDAALELDKVSVTYGDRLALHAVTGRFAAASLTAIVGPNGAGKSTLLKALVGLLPLRSGKLLCPAIEQHRYAYLPQQAELNRDFPINVGELVALGGWRGFGAFRGPPEDLKGQVAAAVGAVGLTRFLDRRIGELSPGELQRALFARLLLQDAAVILLDEPFAALDENTTEDLLGIIKRWQDERRTVIAVLHDLDQVRKHFPATLLLARSVIAWGETDAVLIAKNVAGLGKPFGSPRQDATGP